MWMTDVPRKLTVTTRAILPPPHLAQMVSKGESGREGTPGVDLLANTIDRVRTANSLASSTNKDRHALCAITFSPHRRCPP